MKNNPAKFTDVILAQVAWNITEFKHDIILDPFGGSGKVASIKDSVKATFVCNDIETEWADPKYPVDEWVHADAEFLALERKADVIVTSPTYGNRMADHHNAKDPSRRVTYTHRMGHALRNGNTGVMQFGADYRDKHYRIFRNLRDSCLTDTGAVFLNISNHIRRHQEVDVVSFFKKMMLDLGFALIRDIEIETPRMRFGANRELRPPMRAPAYISKGDTTIEERRVYYEV